MEVNCLFNSIKDLKNKFIISTVDKASNNFCIMCKVFYKKLLMEEYLGNSTYIKITYPYSEIKNRLNAFSKKLKFHISSLTFPYLFITTKFHKNPVKFRYVTCATNSYNCHAGKMFFNLLNKILKVIDEKGNSFIIYNNKPVLDYINANNSHIKSINVYDFENLFGSILHSDIVKVCSDIYEDFSSILNCDKSFWIILVNFCIFENVLQPTLISIRPLLFQDTCL